MTLGPPITYGKLGESFIAFVFTPRRVGPLLEKALGKQMFMSMPAPGGGKADVMIDMRRPEVTRPRLDILRVDLHFDMVINADVGPLHERADIAVTAPFYLRIEAHAPLGVFLNASVVQPNEVLLDVKDATPLTRVLEWLGVTQPFLGEQIANAINDKLRAGPADRFVDVLAMVNRSVPEAPLRDGQASVMSTAAHGEVAAEIREASVPELAFAESLEPAIAAAPPSRIAASQDRGASPRVPSGARLEGELRDAKHCDYYRIAARKGEAIELIVYLQKLGGGLIGGLNASVATVDEEGGLLESQSWTVEATGEDFDKHAMKLHAEEDGDVIVRVRADLVIGETTLRYKILTK